MAVLDACGLVLSVCALSSSTWASDLVLSVCALFVISAWVCCVSSRVPWVQACCSITGETLRVNAPNGECADYVLHYGNGHVTQTTLPSKTDNDVLREHHQYVFFMGQRTWAALCLSILRVLPRFLRDECEREEELSWEARLAKSYYDKLFKEYCLADMTRYKSGKVR